jgi:hypothetical protein
VVGAFRTLTIIIQKNIIAFTNSISIVSHFDERAVVPNRILWPDRIFWVNRLRVARILWVTRFEAEKGSITGLRICKGDIHPFPNLPPNNGSILPEACNFTVMPVQEVNISRSFYAMRVIGWRGTGRRGVGWIAGLSPARPRDRGHLRQLPKIPPRTSWRRRRRHRRGLRGFAFHDSFWNFCDKNSWFVSLGMAMSPLHGPGEHEGERLSTFFFSCTWPLKAAKLQLAWQLKNPAITALPSLLRLLSHRRKNF